MKEDIIRMAREAQIAAWHRDRKCWVVEPGIVHFVALVAAAEREACAKVCDDKAREWRERSVPLLGYSGELEDCAAAIRARSNQ